MQKANCTTYKAVLKVKITLSLYLFLNKIKVREKQQLN